MNQNTTRKKGEITIFIIAGIIAVFLFIFIFVVVNQKREVDSSTTDNLKIKSQADKVKMYVEQCLYDSAVPAVYYVGLTGGYIDPPPKTFRSTKSTIAYYYYFGDDEMPQKQRVEQEISEYIEDTLFLCINNFKGFEDADIIPGNVKAKTLMGENDVTIQLDFPVVISIGDTKMVVSKYQTWVPIRLGHNYDFARKVNDNLLENNGLLQSSVFDDFDVARVILPYDSKRTIYMFKDEEIELDPSMYFFAAVR